MTLRTMMTFAATCTLAGLIHPALAGRIVANHDEWPLSNTGYSNAGPSAGNFAVNLATFLAGPGGNILIYSNNFGLTDSSLQTSLSSAGFTVTISTGVFDLTGFDAVFLGGSPFAKDDTALTNFVNAGGGVYIAAGTGVGGPAAEAAQWNGFLAPFGLQLGSPYNGVSGNDPIDNPAHPLFGGVTQLFGNNGNSVTAGGNPLASVVESTAGGAGLIGVFDSTQSNIPEPGTYLLSAAGLIAIALIRRNRA